MIANDTDTPDEITYYYTPCQNTESCRGNNVMVEQIAPYGSDPDYCYILGRFDPSIQPQYFNDNNTDTWTFIYDNGT